MYTHTFLLHFQLQFLPIFEKWEGNCPFIPSRGHATGQDSLMPSIEEIKLIIIVSLQNLVSNPLTVQIAVITMPRRLLKMLEE